MAGQADHTYTQDPALSTRDQVRFLVGDTDPAKKKLTDAEIDWLITEEANVYLAAAAAAHAIAASFGDLVDKQVGDLKISYSQRQKHYADLARTLEQRGTMAAGTVFVGGISRDEKRAVEDDTDRVDPAFERNIHDHPGTVQRGDTRRLRGDL